MVKETILDYLRKQHLAIIAITCSALTLCHQISADQLQADFIKSQGKNINVKLSRNRMNDENGSNYVWNEKISLIETTWDVEIDNASLQAPATVSGWAIYRKTKTGFDKGESSEDSSWSYTPFFRDSGEPLLLSFTIAAGSTLKIKMKVNLSITQEAAKALLEWKNKRLSLTQAEGLYSFEAHRKGTPLDIFGNFGYDNDGFNLNVPQREREKIQFPIVQLNLNSNRKKTYSSIAGWYYTIFTFSDEKWDQGVREHVKNPDPYGFRSKNEPAITPSNPP